MGMTGVLHGTDTGGTHSMANLSGLNKKTGVGSSAKQVTNIANAARLRPPKTRRRSHRLTRGGAVLATKNSCNQPLSVSCARLHGDMDASCKL